MAGHPFGGAGRPTKVLHPEGENRGPSGTIDVLAGTSVQEAGYSYKLYFPCNFILANHDGLIISEATFFKKQMMRY